MRITLSKLEKKWLGAEVVSEDGLVGFVSSAAPGTRTLWVYSPLLKEFHAYHETKLVITVESPLTSIYNNLSQED